MAVCGADLLPLGFTLNLRVFGHCDFAFLRINFSGDRQG